MTKMAMLTLESFDVSIAAPSPVAGRSPKAPLASR